MIGRDLWSLGAATALVTCVFLAGCSAPKIVPAQRPVVATPALPTTTPPDSGAVQLWVGPLWRASYVLGVDALMSPQPILQWTAPTRLTGNAGCNAFRADAVVRDGLMRLTAIVPTGVPCLQVPPGGQEDKFFSALEATRSYRFEGPDLVLLDIMGLPMVRLSRVR